MEDQMRVQVSLIRAYFCIFAIHSISNSISMISLNTIFISLWTQYKFTLFTHLIKHTQDDPMTGLTLTIDLHFDILDYYRCASWPWPLLHNELCQSLSLCHRCHHRHNNNLLNIRIKFFWTMDRGKWKENKNIIRIHNAYVSTLYDLWPVSHDDHVVGGPPEGVYDGGVAAHHDDAGDEEGDHQLVPGEVDPVDRLILSYHRYWSINPSVSLTRSSPRCRCSRWQTSHVYSWRSSMWTHPANTYRIECHIFSHYILLDIDRMQW